MVLAVLLGLGAAAKLDGLSHREHDHHAHHGDADHAHNHPGNANQPNKLSHDSTKVAEFPEDGHLEERFNIQAGSIRHQEFAAGRPGGESAVKGTYS